MRLKTYSFAFALLGLAFQYSTRSQELLNPVIAVLKCPDRVHAVAFSPDDQILAAGIGWGQKGGARIWSLPSRKVIADITSSTDDDATVEAIAFSGDGKFFAMADWGGNVTLWETDHWKLIKTVARRQKDAKTLSFSPDTTQLLVTTEKTLVLVTLKNGVERVLEHRNFSDPDYIEGRFTDNNGRIVVSDSTSTQILDVESNKKVSSWQVKNLFFGKLSDDKNYLISGGGAMYGEKLLQIFNLPTKKITAQIKGFRDGLFGLALSPDKTSLAVSGGGYGSGGFVSLWDMESGSEMGYVSYGEFPIQSLTYSHDGKILAAGSESGAVVLYDPMKVRGPEVKKQDTSLCGEILREDSKVYMVPLTKVPHPMSRYDNLEYNWKLEIANSDSISPSTNAIGLKNWALESAAQGDKIRIINVQEGNKIDDSKESIVFAQIQNPGWNEGLIAKLYTNGSYMITDNPGKCMALGNLNQLGTDFQTVKRRLIDSGLLGLAVKPLTPGTDHYSMQFISVFFDGVLNTRSDAEDFESMLKGLQPKKREAFNVVYSKEKPFIQKLIRYGETSDLVNTKPSSSR